MKKIDKNLKNAYILCDKTTKEMCLVYYTKQHFFFQQKSKSTAKAVLYHIAVLTGVTH